MADLEKDVAAGRLAPVYIVTSTEPLLSSRALAAIRDAAVPENMRGFNFDVVEGRGAKAANITAMAQTLPMMAERRMVLVRDLHSMPAAELAELIPYLESPNPSTVLVGMCSKVDKRIRFYSRAKKLGFLHELAAPRKLGPWLEGELRRQGITMGRGARDRLIDVVGSDLARLTVAVTQLSLYAGDEAITVDHVDDLIANTRERSVFELTDAIGAGHSSRALRAVSALCDQRQSSIGVVMMLARHMRQLGRCHQGLSQRMSQGELAKLVGAPPFIVDKLCQQARRYQPQAVYRAMSMLAEADRHLKGTSQALKTLGRPLYERTLLEGLARDLIALAD